MKERKFKHIDFYLLDILSLIFSFLIAYRLRQGTFRFFELDIYSRFFVILLVSNNMACFIISPYKDVLKRGYLVELKETIVYSITQLLLVVLYLVIIKETRKYSRIVLFLTYSIYIVISYVTRTLRKRYLRKQPYEAIENGDRLLLVVTNINNINKTVESIKKYNYSMYRIEGLCVVDQKETGNNIDGFRIIANKDNVLEYVCKNWIDEVYFSMAYNEIPKEIISGISLVGISTHIKLDKAKELEGQTQKIETLFDSTVLSSSIRERTNLEKFFKRLMDVCGGLLGSFITLLIAIVIGPIIKIKSPGPVFFKQERIGLNGKHFYMYKFRSMVVDADKMKSSLQKENIMNGALFKVENDPRIIPGIGNFIRKKSIDEFPQFFNVLIGNMSLVGTRPPTLDEWEKYNLSQRIRMSVMPGITGIWQASGRNKITDFNKVVEMDKYYINNWSLSLDIKILFKTLYVLLFKKDDGAM